MDAAWARRQFAGAEVARLATADAAGRPHLVPIVFAIIGDNTLYWTVDGKPKSTRQLRRLDNIVANPRVSALVDRYADDWDELWWARADGTARILAQSSAESATALIELARRYSQYRDNPPPGPVVAVDVERWSGWSAQP